MIWTPAAITRLRELWDSGIPTAQIGRALGCSKNSVVGKAKREALTPRESPIKYSADRKPREYKKPVPRLPRPPICLIFMEAPRGRVEPCCWPTSDGRPWRYCDEPSLPGRSYCEEHFSVSLLRRRMAAE